MQGYEVKIKAKAAYYRIYLLNDTRRHFELS